MNTYTDDEILTALRRNLAAERWIQVAVLLEMLGAQSPELVEAIRDEITARDWDQLASTKTVGDALCTCSTHAGRAPGDRHEIDCGIWDWDGSFLPEECRP